MSLAHQTAPRPSPGQHLLDAINIRAMRAEHIEDVAQLHYAELSWSFNGQLGLDHVRELYQALASSPHFFGFVAYRNGKLLGFVSATTSSQEIRRSIREVYRGKTLRVLNLMLRNPAFLMGTLESLFVVPVLFRRCRTAAEWLTFVTDTRASYLTSLVAIRLIDTVRDGFRERGIDLYAAQGVKQNPRAMQLYAKLGWEVAATLIVHKVYIFRSNAPSASTVLKERGKLK